MFLLPWLPCTYHCKSQLAGLSILVPRKATTIMSHLLRNSVCMIGLALWASLPAAAQTVSPTRYDVRNGYTSNYSYWDDTYNGSGNTHLDGAALTNGLGQLTDGVIGGAHYDDNLGNGPAYEWVGWNSPVTIHFFFNAPVTFSNIALRMVQNEAGIIPPSSINFTFSDDGSNFGNAVNYALTPSELSAATAQWITAPTPRTGQYVNVSFSDGIPFLSEVTFTGTQSTETPEPGSLALLVGMGLSVAGGLFLKRRRILAEKRKVTQELTTLLTQ